MEVSTQWGGWTGVGRGLAVRGKEASVGLQRERGVSLECEKAVLAQSKSTFGGPFAYSVPFIMGIFFLDIMGWSPSPRHRRARSFCRPCSDHHTSGPGSENPVTTGLACFCGGSVLPGPKEKPSSFQSSQDQTRQCPGAQGRE